MLYLPPRFAHDGVALDPCMTYSIGFRAPTTQEVVTEFLAYLQERITAAGMYADPDLRATRRRGEIGRAMVGRVAAMIDHIRWSRSEIEDFLGCYLTEPKPQVFFAPPADPLSARSFRALTRRYGVGLDPKTQLLYRGTRFFVNGDAAQVPRADRNALRVLADARVLATTAGLGSSALQMIYAWYRCGFCHPLGGAS